jgi:hypothetical protein
VDWGDVSDKHSDKRVTVTTSPRGTYGWHLVNDEVSVPCENDLTPVAMLDDFEGVQPHRVSIVGEKSSLYDILEPVSTRYGTDLFLEND